MYDEEELAEDCEGIISCERTEPTRTKNLLKIVTMSELLIIIAEEEERERFIFACGRINANKLAEEREERTCGRTRTNLRKNAKSV